MIEKSITALPLSVVARDFHHVLRGQKEMIVAACAGGTEWYRARYYAVAHEGTGQIEARIIVEKRDGKWLIPECQNPPYVQGVSLDFLTILTETACGEQWRQAAGTAALSDYRPVSGGA
ncbi:hypothetical protein [Corynebacterium sputi]|uniref:hypothetical protein n=1 Tax=Corynebacterium sputi TaxID=489915 RepID=UPI00047A4822|nr:hypothetical protein [Corynebacterium sputi]